MAIKNAATFSQIKNEIAKRITEDYRNWINARQMGDDELTKQHGARIAALTSLCSDMTNTDCYDCKLKMSGKCKS